jgi:PIN domain nuclease of toxin-antitoxin system
MILLDTHALVWLAVQPRRLSRTAASAIRRAIGSGGFGIAAISLWELAMLYAQGRLRTAGTVQSALTELLTSTGVSVRELTPEVAALAVHFPDDFPADPADRLIAATARAEGIPLITADTRIQKSALVRTIW